MPPVWSPFITTLLSAPSAINDKSPSLSVKLEAAAASIDTPPPVLSIVIAPSSDDSAIVFASCAEIA